VPIRRSLTTAAPPGLSAGIIRNSEKHELTNLIAVFFHRGPVSVRTIEIPNTSQVGLRLVTLAKNWRIALFGIASKSRVA
jgi:hypothetical protein